MKKIILATGSLKKIEIFRKLNIPFETQIVRIDEFVDKNLPPDEIVKKLSIIKAQNASMNNIDSVIISTEAVAAFNEKLILSPRHRVEAKEIMIMLSGNHHSILTGYTVYDTQKGRIFSRTEETKVFFKKLNLNEIEDYLNSSEYIGNPGGYLIYGKGSLLVDYIEGSFHNACGFPLEAIKSALIDFGIIQEEDARFNTQGTPSGLSFKVDGFSPLQRRGQKNVASYTKESSQSFDQARLNRYSENRDIFKYSENKTNISIKNKVNGLNASYEKTDANTFLENILNNNLRNNLIVSNTTRGFINRSNDYIIKSDFKKHGIVSTKNTSTDINGYSQDKIIESDINIQKHRQKKNIKISKSSKKDLYEEESEKKVGIFNFIKNVTLLIFGQDIFIRLIFGIVAGILAFGIIFGFIGIF